MARIERLCREETTLTADTALRLGRVFGTGPEFWINLQAMHDLASVADTDIADIQPLVAHTL